MPTNNPMSSVDRLVTLAECPIGLFWHGDTLALKTEYGNNEGRIDAYIVESGEFYWGDAPQTIASQRAGLVAPIDTDEALATLKASPEAAAVISKLVEALEAAPIPGCNEPMAAFYERMNDWLNTTYREALALVASPLDGGGM